MNKRLISLLLCLAIVCSFCLSVGATDVSFNEGSVSGASGKTTQEITIHIPPRSSAIVPYGWVGSGSIINYPVGTLTAGKWVYFTITDNSAGIPVIVQLCCDYGAAYSSSTLTLGTTGWKAKVSKSHYLLITNDNNYGTDISFYLTYY